MADVKNADILSGKRAEDENFPVGSRLLPARLRPHVARYYRFARLADDIADSPDLSGEEKLARLNALDAVLQGEQEADRETAPAADVRKSFLGRGIPVSRASELLEAFRLDARGTEYRTFQDLMAYCRRSAAPVGRFLLDLHGENRLTFFPADNLCAALQVLNHLQDCKKDYLTLNRIYLPSHWMQEAGATPEMLAEDHCPLPLRQVIDKTLKAVDGLFIQAAPLPTLVQSRGLRMEICIIDSLARKLRRRLGREDPLARDVDLKKTDWIRAVLGGLPRRLLYPRRLMSRGIS